MAKSARPGHRAPADPHESPTGPFTGQKTRQERDGGLPSDPQPRDFVFVMLDAFRGPDGEFAAADVITVDEARPGEPGRPPRGGRDLGVHVLR